MDLCEHKASLIYIASSRPYMIGPCLKKKENESWTWWHTPFWFSQRKKDIYEFKSSLVYIMSFRPAKAYNETLSKQKLKKGGETQRLYLSSGVD